MKPLYPSLALALIIKRAVPYGRNGRNEWACQPQGKAIIAPPGPKAGRIVQFGSVSPSRSNCEIVAARISQTIDKVDRRIRTGRSVLQFNRADGQQGTVVRTAGDIANADFGVVRPVAMPMIMKDKGKDIAALIATPHKHRLAGHLPITLRDRTAADRTLPCAH